ncbi:Slbp [Scenedesmus sp. PABB004]|nr:Slbp [Scenedesmus sp. PABB004]
MLAPRVAGPTPRTAIGGSQCAPPGIRRAVPRAAGPGARSAVLVAAQRGFGKAAKQRSGSRKSKAAAPAEAKQLLGEYSAVKQAPVASGGRAAPAARAKTASAAASGAAATASPAAASAPPKPAAPSKPAAKPRGWGPAAVAAPVASPAVSAAAAPAPEAASAAAGDAPAAAGSRPGATGGVAAEAAPAPRAPLAAAPLPSGFTAAGARHSGFESKLSTLAPRDAPPAPPSDDDEAAARLPAATTPAIARLSAARDDVAAAEAHVHGLAGLLTEAQAMLASLRGPPPEEGAHPADAAAAAAAEQLVGLMSDVLADISGEMELVAGQLTAASADIDATREALAAATHGDATASAREAAARREAAEEQQAAAANAAAATHEADGEQARQLAALRAQLELRDAELSVSAQRNRQLDAQLALLMPGSGGALPGGGGGEADPRVHALLVSQVASNMAMLDWLSVLARTVVRLEGVAPADRVKLASTISKRACKMRGCTLCLVALLSVLQLGTAVAVIAITAVQLAGVDSFAWAEVINQKQCLASADPKNLSVCTYIYAVGGVSIAMTLIIGLLQLVTCNMCGCGKYMDAVFTVVAAGWWLVAGFITAAHARGAGAARVRGRGARTWVVLLCWVTAGLFAALFIVHLARIGVSCCRKRRGARGEADLEKAGLRDRPPSAAVELGKERARRSSTMNVEHAPAGGAADQLGWADEVEAAEAGADALLPECEEEAFETDPKRLLARQKQIDYGKNTLGYERYVQAVPKEKRKRYGKDHDPPTPDVTQRMSKKAWDGIVSTPAPPAPQRRALAAAQRSARGWLRRSADARGARARPQVKAWRRHLHKYDDAAPGPAGAGAAEASAVSDPAALAVGTRGGSADSSGRGSSGQGKLHCKQQGRQSDRQQQRDRPDKRAHSRGDGHRNASGGGSGGGSGAGSGGGGQGRAGHSSRAGHVGSGWREQAEHSGAGRDGGPSRGPGQGSRLTPAKRDQQHSGAGRDGGPSRGPGQGSRLTPAKRDQQASRFVLDEIDGLPARELLQAKPNCTRVHPACTACRNQRIPGTRRSELVCSTCAAGYRLRQDRTGKNCDCAPGFSADDTGACATCPRGQFCLGGGASNPGNNATDCPAGLATVFTGAKTQSQCFTTPGFGRQTAKGADGKTSFVSRVCPIGTYNAGGNQADCQKCGNGLTTATNGSTSGADCQAPAGSYVDKSVGKKCQKGTFSVALNSDAQCTKCPDGLTTAGEGSKLATDCTLAVRGWYKTSATTAAECPVNSYNDAEADITSCTPCPNGWKTKDTAATGAALCMAPPGWELKDGASAITECDVGSYKADWNRNPCVACGTNIITADTGSVSADACLVPAGYGVTTTSPLAAAKCTTNSYGDDSPRPATSVARCTPCAQDTYTLDTLTGVPLAANAFYTSEQDCKVKAGWGLTNTDPNECAKGSWNAGNNRAACTPCAAGRTTSSTGATAATDCVIQPGWRLAGSVPAPCDKGSWSAGGVAGSADPTTCTPCASGFTTADDEATSAGDCAFCAAGYGYVGTTPCAECGYNTYASGGAASTEPCTPCAANTVSQRGATQVQMCFAALVDVKADVLNLASEAGWTAATASSVAACGTACTGAAGCIMYRWAEASKTCQVANVVAGGATTLGFKVGAGEDYVLRTTDQTMVGLQVGTTATGSSLAECRAACTASNECELFVLAGTACKLARSELDADYVSMFQVRGDALANDA